MNIYFTVTHNSLSHYFQYIVFVYIYFVSIILVSIIITKSIEEAITQSINIEPIKSLSEMSTQTQHEVNTIETQTNITTQKDNSTQTNLTTQKDVGTQTSYNYDTDKIDIVDDIY
jgi:hypothetical protein